MKTMRPLIVGIGCRARQGKMLTAKAMHCAMPERSWIFGLADALKAKLRAEGLMGVKNSRMCQIFGTDVVRAADPLRWVRTLEHTAREFAADYGADIIIVPDVRFRNEAEWVTRVEGVLVRVDRVMPDGTTYVDRTRDPGHASENDLNDFDVWDHVISARDGDLAGLAQKAVAVLHEALRSRNGVPS